MTPDSPRWRQQIAFRDALRADPILAGDYAAHKRLIATEHAGDRETYSAAKSEFVKTALN